MEEKTAEQWEALFCDRYPFSSYRVACNYIADTLDRGNESTLKYMLNRGILLGGRFYANIKAPAEKRQLANCFALDVEDNRDAWADHVGRVARLTLFGGGVGTDYSKLRPEGSECMSTPGLLAGGPCSLIKATDAMTAELKSCRRGALLAQLVWSHQDINKFMHLKDRAPGAPKPLERTNISVQYNPLWHDIMDEGSSHYQYAQARSVLEENLEQAVTKSEPGLSFNGRKQEGGRKPFGRLQNPCLPGDVLLLTPEGTRELNQIGVGDKVWTGKKFATVTAKWETGVKPVFAYCGEGENSVLRCTSNHRIVTDLNNSKEEASRALTIVRNYMLSEDHSEAEVLPIKQLWQEEDRMVYDITVEDEEHTFWCNGYLVSNCAELRAENDGACCNIGTIFLYNLMENNIDDDKLIRRGIKAGSALVRLLMHGGQQSVRKDEIATRVHEEENRLLMGWGGSAMVDAVIGRARLKRVLTEISGALKEYAAYYAMQIGLPIPIALFGCAPNGTTGIIAGCTGGIEFPFAEAYVRNIADQKGFGRPKQHVFVDSGFERVFKDYGVAMKTAQTVSLEERLEWQAFMQDFCDMGISSTVNLPRRGEPGNDMSVSEIADIVLKYHRRLAGLTFYADGSIEGQPLTAIPFEEARKLIGDNSSAVLEDNESLIALSNLMCRGGTCGS